MRIALRRWFSRKTLGKDLAAGAVLGVESVPDGLAAGLLAGVNPLAGLYAYLFGMVGAAFFTSSSFMAVQATGAMALVVADADLESRVDPERALYTLAMLSGVAMVVAGLLRAGRLVRFVPTAVMTGFVTAVGVNIVLGQLSNFTGYQAQGANRIVRTIDTLLHILQWSVPAVMVGSICVLIIVCLQPTRFRSLGLVAAVIVASACGMLLALWMGAPVAFLRDVVDVPRGLPAPVLPQVDDVLYLIVPACSLAFVGIVQGAGVSASIPTAAGRPRADPSRDVIGQGFGNVVSGLFRGMPVGGSMSASALLVAAGAKTRLALFVAAAVMGLVVLVASDLVAYVAMPALAGLLIVIGISAIKPGRVYSVIKTGPLQTAVMAVTFALTLLIPLQFAVLAGVGLGIILFVAQASNRVRVREVRISDDGRMRETDPRPVIPPSEVVILQPYGSMFFASAPTVERQLPSVSQGSRHSVVIIRLRGTDQIGLAHLDVLERYARLLADADSVLKLVVSEERLLQQIRVVGLTEIGPEDVYRGDEWIGRTTRRAYDDARRWVDEQS
ncbi:SulP family inorganic anion transporter [Microbacterium murale]|uniref:Sulfate transporter n=1 Tax=Microbacterium murale TaxID=1081040 RepID=A0ABQ1RTM2_9MICO|nr:SulP family inorganic anion transporter [Microbacterium murale]GGD81730.1 putative sulfate transporter [Microbacterium murale]